MAKKNKQKTGEMRIPTDELKKEYQESLEITEAEIQARAEAETAAENIDSVPEPIANVSVVDGATEIELTESEKEDLLKESKSQVENIQPQESNPDYLQFAAEAVGYANRQDQWAVYRTISNYFTSNDSILDFGAGRGDFERFYQTEFRTDLDYIGIDMNQQLVDASKIAYNDEVDIRCLNWFELPKDVICDYSINIISNNLRYDADTTRDDITYLKDTIKSMMEHCTKGSVLLLSSDSPEIEDGLINWNAGDIFNWAQKEFGNVALDHSFSKDLFTLIIYKNEEDNGKD